MVVSDTSTPSQVQGVHNIMGGIENTGDVRLHNHRRKLKQRFDIVKKLGQGTYGKVQLGINKETGQEVAIKTIRKCKIETEADLIRIRREIQIMSSVRHPNIIHIYEVFENREKMVLVMEYAAGGELYDYLSERKVLGEDEARRIFRQIATAVYYCHKHNICHRDLKLENILLDEIGNAKIADFGLSNVFSFNALLSTFCGSPLYASPEIVKGTPYHGPEVDCWSLGVLLYTLVYGAMPFDGSNFRRLVKQISHGNYFEPKNPSPASSLIADMLNVNPARRADITAICSHRWMNDTYKEMCLDVAEDLASQTPVRLDLLLSLTAPAVNPSSIVVDADQVAAGDGLNGSGRPVRSQSLGSIPPTAVPPTNVIPFPVPEIKEVKETVQDDKKVAKTKKKERSHSRTRRKERSRSRSRKSDGKESPEKDARANDDEAENDVAAKAATAAAPLVNSGTQVLTKASSDDSKEVPSIPAVDAAASETTGECKEAATVTSVEGEAKPKPVERRRSSKVYEVAEKFQPASEKPVPKVPPPKKVILQGINVDDARKEFEKRTASVASGSSSPPKKNSTPDSNVTADDIPFPLASTVALNKLVESAFRDESPFDAKQNEAESADKVAPKLLNSSSAEGNSNKAATLPRRRTSRAEIQLIAPQLPTDNYKTEVEHFINKPAVNHKTEIVFPVNAPLPPKPLTKQDNQSKEHVIPIQIEQEAPAPRSKVTSPSASYATSKSSIPRTSSSSLSRQSTVDSDSGSTISTGEPIRKSPREVIIPIAVEGGGFVTPSEDTLTRMNSMNDSEDESRNGSRCFTLRSTKRRQPEKSQTAQLDTADSLSSDEDDNFQLLTAENLFSTLLSRVRSLTQRLNNDEMRRSSAFPRSLFAQHGSLFDSMPRSRITDSRSFNRPESAPWRRTLSQGQVAAPQRDDSIKKRYSRLFEERASVPATITPHDERKPPAPTTGGTINHHHTKPDSSTTTATTTTNKPFESEPSFSSTKANALTKTASLPSNKTSIEDEFDKFFSRYKKPTDSFAFKYATRASPIRSRMSPSALRRCGGGGGRQSQEMDGEAAKPTCADDKQPLPLQQQQQHATSGSRPPPRKSRFLRPDFYDTPREESKYVIQNEKVRAFRERSLSRQRDLSRNRGPSALTNGWNSGDYLRSKTCSIADKMEAAQQSRAGAASDFRRTISEDRTATAAAAANGNDGRFELTRSNSRVSRDSVDSFQKAKRKSLILQNELENEVRKTQNMYSKLSGLMDALNDNESQYERKLEKLYGLRPQREKSPACEEAAAAAATAGKERQQQREARADTRDSQSRGGGGGDKPSSSNYDNLSLLDKKYAYFRKLRNNEQGENGDGGATENGVAAGNESKAASASSAEDGPTAASEEVDSSDACSILSDGTDFENLNDRIRRRSFYTRFNSYGSGSAAAAAAAPSRTTSARPLSNYSRSMSADVGGPPSPGLSSTTRTHNGHDPHHPSK